jgi:hypothetical protein
MRYIKTYSKLFESGNTSFDWLKKQSNERYIDLMYILQSDLFDDYDIVSKSDESFEMGIDEPGYPQHKFWTFRQHKSGPYDEDTSDINTDKDIKSIIVYNISDDEKDSFWNSLIEIKDKVRSLIGKELSIEEEGIGTPECPSYYDYIIKLGDKFEMKRNFSI